jgi:hypothetical protein
MGAGVMKWLDDLLWKYRGLWLLLLFTLIVRGGLLIARFDQLQADPDAYHLIAHNMVRFACFSVDDPTLIGSRSGEPAPSAFRPPLYPVLLSNLAIGKDKIIYWEAIALLHLAMGIATVWITWLIARALQLGWASYLAGVLVACDPILLNQQSLIMTETLGAFCTVLAWGLLVRFHFDRNWWNAALAGGAIGLAAMCRPTYLPWLAVAAVVALFLQPGLFVATKADEKTKKPRQWGMRIFNATALLVTGLGIMFPWAWRNYQVFQEPLLTTTHGGYTLYLANNRHFYSYLRNDRSGLPWEPQKETVWWGKGLQYSQSFEGEQRSLLQQLNPPSRTLDYSREFTDDKIQARAALDTIHDDPAGFLLAAAYRTRQLWSPLPHRLSTSESKSRLALRYLTAAWYLAVYALLLVGVFHLRWNLLRSPWLFGVLLCAIFTGVHLFYWCNLRMRAPLMPIVAVVAAAGALHLQERRTQARG